MKRTMMTLLWSRFESISLLLLFCLTICFCSKKQDSLYERIDHKGARLTQKIEGLLADTIYCPASMTSMSGQWILRDSELVFLDKYAVGIKHFSLDGKFLKENVKKGRGPGEVTAPAWISFWDSSQGQLIVHDKNCAIQLFARDDSLIFDLQGPWFSRMDEKYDPELWKERALTPDLSHPQIYDYNYECRRIVFSSGYLYIPVIAEHPKLNGYDKHAGSRKYWKEAGLFISFVPDSILETSKLIGRYPPIYVKQNIPVFSTYDFFIKDNLIHVSFAADPNIYVLDLEGYPVHCYGEREKGISSNYPETKTFEEYERVYKSQREKHGYYGRLIDVGDYSFRTCYLDSGEWLLQVYKDYDLVRVLECGSEINVLGEQDGWYYADAGGDFKNERFVIVKFKL